jgi:hypothetical protein
MQKSITYQLKNLTSDLKSAGNLIAEKVNDTLASIFYGDKLNDIAKKTNFVQRSSSKIKGNEFVQAMVMASIDPESTPLSGINDNLREISPEAKMTISALRQRINNPKAQEFLKQVYQCTIETHLKPLSHDLNNLLDQSKGALEYFKKVLIHDSSSCALNELLEEEFKGAGGGGSKSQVKIDLMYDLKANNAEEIIITDIREPDQGLSKRILKHTGEGVLTIQDLGYFDIDSFSAVDAMGGYYLSRLPGINLVYANKEDKQPIELGKLLQKMAEDGKPLDIEVFITQKKVKTRLVAYLVPDEVFNKRLRTYHKKNKKKTPRAEWVARQRFTILITNVPSEIWPYNIVGTIYKIRWQIELIFKTWKSQMSIHYLKGTKPERIWCLLYSRMIAAALIFTIYSGVKRLICPIGCELSLPKFVNWLKRSGRFVKIILRGFDSSLWNQLMNGLDLLCKDWQRKRKTTRNMIEEEIPFLETFKTVGVSA